VRVICPGCREIDEAATADERMNKAPGQDNITVYHGRGCEKCAYTGFYGREGIFELLKIDNSIHQLIVKNADAHQIRETARRNGMRTLLEDGLIKVKSGRTTVNEIFRVTQEI
jgi:type II secretory ATPase GspE/PulE/Tfp pilus assembly ATPase PilB-like protein